MFPYGKINFIGLCEIVGNNGKRYRGDLYMKACDAANRDERLKKEIERVEDEYIDRWYNYFLCEERQKEGK